MEQKNKYFIPLPDNMTVLRPLEGKKHFHFVDCRKLSNATFLCCNQETGGIFPYDATCNESIDHAVIVNRPVCPICGQYMDPFFDEEYFEPGGDCRKIYYKCEKCDKYFDYPYQSAFEQSKYEKRKRANRIEKSKNIEKK